MKKVYQKPTILSVVINTESLMINVSETQAASGTAAMSRGGSNWEDED